MFRINKQNYFENKGQILFPKLHDWIDINKINWNNLSSNPNAMEFLKKIKIKLIGINYQIIQMQMNY